MVMIYIPWDRIPKKNHPKKKTTPSCPLNPNISREAMMAPGRPIAFSFSEMFAYFQGQNARWYF